MADKAPPPHLFADVLARVHAVCGVLAAEGGWPAGIDLSRVVVEPPRDAAHGDMATNAAMVLAKEAKAKPRDLAEAIAAKLRADDLIASVDVAGPGFINLTLKPKAWSDALRTVLREGDAYGRSAMGAARRSMSNMSRPIRPGRCMSGIAAARCSATRCAACWRSRAMTSPANITSTTPARRSTCSRARHICRYREALGENIGAIPEGLYPGDYLKPVGQALAAEYGDRLLAMPEDAMASGRARQVDRDDDGGDQGRSRRAQHPA